MMLVKKTCPEAVVRFLTVSSRLRVSRPSDNLINKHLFLPSHELTLPWKWNPGCEILQSEFIALLLKMFGSWCFDNPVSLNAPPAGGRSAFYSTTISSPCLLASVLKWVYLDLSQSQKVVYFEEPDAELKNKHKMCYLAWRQKLIWSISSLLTAIELLEGAVSWDIMLKMLSCC